MGSSRQPSSLEVAAKTVALAAARRTPCTRELALIGAKFCPRRVAAEVLDWLDDPVLVASAGLPEGISAEMFELVVPDELQEVPNARLQTTLVLPSGKRIAIKAGHGQVFGSTLSISVPIVGLNAMGQWTLEVWTTADEIEETRRHNAAIGNNSRVISPQALENECPIILASDLPAALNGTETCSVCKELLWDVSDTAAPLRQLCAAPHSTAGPHP